MSPITFLLLSLLIFNWLFAFAQDNKSVFMKWKIKPGESITYKTVMDETDTAANNISFNGMNKMMGGDSAQSNNFMKMAMQLNQQLAKNGYITTLTAKQGDAIDIEMRTDNTKKDNVVAIDTSKADSDMMRFKGLMELATQGVMLRGAITEEGAIKSFYL